MEGKDARALLGTLPVMKRSDIQANPAAFIAEGTEHFMDDATGGSTGTPMRFKVDRATQIAREASLYWSDHLAGWRYGERIAMLWGSDKDVKSATQEFRAKARWWIENRRWYNAFDMGEERMAAFHRSMSRFRPHIIVAYAGSLEVYARFLESAGVNPAYPLTSSISSAEMLTPAGREVVERVFGKPVFDRYGNREFGAIAAECAEHNGLHVNEADCILEIDSPDPFTVPGNLLVTYLRNFAMPFVRYDTGDLARLESETSCACGRATIRLAPIIGRTADTIRTASGKLIHGEFFTHLMYPVEWVSEFQFIQETQTRYRLLLVANRPADLTAELQLKRSVLEEVGPEAEVELEYVDRLAALPSGKRKFTLSRL